jgi:acetyl esterase
VTSERSRPLYELSVAEARALEAARPSARLDDGAVEATDVEAPVPIRIVRPRMRGLPVCLWLPGGGWVVDTSAAAEPACRAVAAAAPCALAIVRYRLAPEHPFPAGLEDGLAALRWLVAHGAGLGLDTGRPAIGGTSAGGNLAAALALRLRSDPEVELAAQVLVYPPLLHGSCTASMRTVGDPAVLDGRSVEWCWSHYLRTPEDGRDPLASPLLATDLAGLPPALVIVASNDPLRDEGEDYARRLDSAGVPTELARFDGVGHGFFSSTLDTAREARALVAATLARVFEQ